MSVESDFTGWLPRLCHVTGSFELFRHIFSASRSSNVAICSIPYHTFSTHSPIRSRNNCCVLPGLKPLANADQECCCFPPDWSQAVRLDDKRVGLSHQSGMSHLQARAIDVTSDSETYARRIQHVRGALVRAPAILRREIIYGSTDENHNKRERERTLSLSPIMALYSSGASSL